MDNKSNTSPAPALGAGEAVAWQWRSRVKGGAWDAWENGRYASEPAPFMDVEHRLLYTHPSPVDAAVERDAAHPDDLAVDRFAAAMKEKMAESRAKGRSGWESCPPETLSLMLIEHATKGDPRDVANFCMMLWNLGANITAPGYKVADPVFLAWVDELVAGCKQAAELLQRDAALTAQQQERS